MDAMLAMTGLVGWAPRAHQPLAHPPKRMRSALVGRGCPPYEAGVAGTTKSLVLG